MARNTYGMGNIFRRSRKGKRTGPWWIAYHVNGREYRESSKSARKADAVDLLKQRQREVQ